MRQRTNYKRLVKHSSRSFMDRDWKPA